MIHGSMETLADAMEEHVDLEAMLALRPNR